MTKSTIGYISCLGILACGQEAMTPAVLLPDGGSDSGVTDESVGKPLDKPKARCGDHQCDSGETCRSCSADCGNCPKTPTCGDGTCTPGENSCECRDDCSGPCCGNDDCEGGESCSTCTQDCGACVEPPACGDGECRPGESACNCVADCRGPCCGNGSCEAGESTSTCAGDCPAPPQTVTTCGDGNCASGESASSCAEDCGCGADWGQCGEEAPGGCFCDDACVGMGDCCPDACSECKVCGGVYCGDDNCDPGETADSCATDCGCAAGLFCSEAAPAGCMCDDYCVSYGDCCADACFACGACGPVCGDDVCQSGETASSCAEDCGCASARVTCDDPSPGGCYCDAECVAEGDCCPDACLICGSCASRCGDGQCDRDETDNSCAEDCGCEGAGWVCSSDLAPGGCYCDSRCTYTYTCCADACSWCGACE